MTQLGRATIPAAVLLSAISIMDAVYKGVTGGAAAVWDDSSGNRGLVATVNAVMAVTFALLAAVLVNKAQSIDAGGRVVPWVRRLLITALSVLSAVFIAGIIFDGYPGPLEASAGIAFLCMFVFGVLLGAAMLRRPEQRLPALLLVSPLALLPATLLLDAAAPGWGHPGYAETALYIGLALLDRLHTRHPTAGSPTPDPATTHP